MAAQYDSTEKPREKYQTLPEKEKTELPICLPTIQKMNQEKKKKTKNIKRQYTGNLCKNLSKEKKEHKKVNIHIKI